MAAIIERDYFPDIERLTLYNQWLREDPGGAARVQERIAERERLISLRRQDRGVPLSVYLRLFASEEMETFDELQRRAKKEWAEQHWWVDEPRRDALRMKGKMLPMEEETRNAGGAIAASNAVAQIPPTVADEVAAFARPEPLELPHRASSYGSESDLLSLPPEAPPSLAGDVGDGGSGGDGGRGGGGDGGGGGAPPPVPSGAAAAAAATSATVSAPAAIARAGDARKRRAKHRGGAATPPRRFRRLSPAALRLSQKLWRKSQGEGGAPP